MKTSVYNEIFRTKIWNITRNALVGYSSAMRQHAIDDEEFSSEGKVTNAMAILRNGAETVETLYVDDAEWLDRWGKLDEEDQVINIMYVTGPVTRGGGACSYGSVEYRDQMRYAANMKQCIAHLFVIDTPGGSAFAKNDFRMGIDAAHEAGQPVFAWIDGQCASAGMALAAMCDETWFMQPEAQVGCIGTLCAGYITENGAKNAVTQEKYFEIYDPESTEKNGEWRALAEGDESLLLEELRADGAAFRALVKRERPGTPDEMCHGKLYNAVDTIGTLTDGQCTKEDLVARIVAIHNGDEQLLHDKVSTFGMEPEGSEGNEETTEEPKPEDKPSDDPDTPNNDPDRNPGNENEKNNNPKYFTEMKEYPQMNAAMGLNVPFEADHNGAYFNEQMCDDLEKALENGKKAQETLDAKMTEITKLNDVINTLKADHDQAMKEAAEKAAADHDEAMKKHQEQCDEKCRLTQEEVDRQVGELNGKLTEANETLTKKEEEIESLKKQLADKEKELEEMAGKPATEPAPAPAESNDGSQRAQTPANRIFKEGMTAAEKRHALEMRKLQLQGARI